VEAAENLSITLETARSYSKTIYTKSGRSRPDGPRAVHPDPRPDPRL